MRMARGARGVLEEEGPSGHVQGKGRKRDGSKLIKTVPVGRAVRFGDRGDELVSLNDRLRHEDGAQGHGPGRRNIKETVGKMENHWKHPHPQSPGTGNS